MEEATQRPLMAPLVIYHSPCDDGMGAVYAMSHAVDDFEPCPGVYQVAPPDVTGRDVMLLDFCYSRAVMNEIATKARSVLVLDHHKTAMQGMEGYGQALDVNWADHLRNPAVRVLFDLSRSGAGIAWDFFMAGNARPKLIDYIEAQDLAKYDRFPYVREFTAGLRSHPMNPKTWAGLTVDNLIGDGGVILRAYRAQVESFKAFAFKATIANNACVICNVPTVFATDVGGELLASNPDVQFAATYVQKGSGVFVYSLRSRPDFDCSAIAKKFGGGGHPQASGFTHFTLVHEKPI